ncbi:hypothetical protein GCM10010508_05470 [Streptomyces naganishii JCM 4654]|uniref:Uncharacterized protein n=1 Tax=Streptomyces naganishii JCM 4654 TaxID=1306179 RepID=A0A918XYK1_9ACTN|nr:hypothetical protein GCM10010508_05470 [Streptomyces naganishii JCM 4654]
MMAGRRFSAASTMPTMIRRVVHARVEPAVPGSGGMDASRCSPGSPDFPVAAVAAGAGSVVDVVRVVSSHAMRPIIE